MRFLLLVIIIAGAAPLTAGANILCLFPLPEYSHWTVFEPLLLALAERGHHLTVLSHFPQKSPVANYSDISIAGLMPGVVNNCSFDVIEDWNFLKDMYALWTEVGTDVCEQVYKSPQVVALSKSTEHFDLIITEVFGTDCFLGFAHKFQAPVVGMSSTLLLPWINDMVDVPDNPSYITDFWSLSYGEMDIFNRIANVFLQIFAKIGYHYMSRLPSERYARELFPDMPPLIDLSHNLSLILSNSHFSIHGSKPQVPALVEVGGLHIKEEQPLPLGLLAFLDAATEGVVFFSMGSMMRSETIPEAQLKAIIAGLASLPQLVLWKVNETLLPQPVPQNIFTQTWMPQRDVLCHPNVVAFVTHGGLLGTEEAIYCGVPLMGIPLFGDQVYNMKSYVERGVARSLTMAEITEDTFRNSLNLLLQEPSYKENAKKMMVLFRDRPQRPLDTAIYWTEYVIKYKGAPRLRTGAKNLKWYQVYFLDVVGIVVGFVIVCFVVANALFNYIFKTAVTEKVKKN